MKRLSLVTWFFVLLSATAAAETKQIPLDQIWGYNLPETRDIAGIPLPVESEKGGREYATLRSERERNIETVRRSLSQKPPAERSLPGFVYPRKPDFFTLRAVASQLLDESKNQRRRPRTSSLLSGNEYTLVFFSHPTSYYVRLRGVERKDNTFVVKYQFEPHKSQEVTTHFALIPLGALKAGEYHVELKRIPERDIDFQLVQDSSVIVCNSFSFKVLDPPVYADEATAEGASIIPLQDIWANRMPGTTPVQELEDLSGVESEKELFERSYVLQISRSLSRRLEEGEETRPVFVVAGDGREALEKAAGVFRGNIMPADEFSTDDNLTLVFHSLQSGWYIHLTSVGRTEHTFTIKYRPVSHMTFDVTTHFALIPLGRLTEGRNEVKVECLKPAQGAKAVVFEPWRLVARDFKFIVK